MIKILAIVTVLMCASATARAQSCWACMHGCTTEQRIKFCHLNRQDLRDEVRMCREIAKREHRDPRRCRQYEGVGK